MYRWQVMNRIAEQRVIGIVRADEAGAAVDAAGSLVGAGLRIVEVAFTTPGTTDAIRELARPAHADALIGAGTVLDAASARLAILAGARFLVSPHVDLQVIAAGHRYDVPVLPGAHTVTEIVAAMEAGADAVKLFPASIGGPAGLRDLRGPLPHVPFIPTGGVTIADAPDYIAAGAVAVGLGSALTKGTAAETADRARALLEALREAAL